MSAEKKYIVTTDLSVTDGKLRGGLNKGRRVCVVGGGIGGLTAALAFARSGAVVEVHEQAVALTEIGAGIQITPNGARALEDLGLGPALDAASITAIAMEPTDALTGRAVTRFELSQLEGPPYRLFHRADLIGVLAQACRDAGVRVHLGSKVQSETLDADIVVGAEGLHSKTRTVLNGPSEPFFTGHVAWRAIIDAPGAEPVGRIWMAPERHLVTYPLSGGRLNIVAVQERSDWAEEGWHHSDDPQNLRDAFAGMSKGVMDLLNKVEQVNLWGLFRHPIAQVWGKDDLCMIGDAAHPTLPFLAQGANLAIEDAYVLARCCNREQEVNDGIARYEAERKPRVTRAIEAAKSNAQRFHLGGFERRMAFMGLRTLGFFAPKAFLGRMDWLYGHDVTQDAGLGADEDDAELR